MADKVHLALQTQLTKRIARTDLTVYRNVHAAKRRMLGNGAAHDVMRQLLIVTAGLRRQQAQTREIGGSLSLKAVHTLLMRPVVFLTGNQQHLTVTGEQQVHQTGAHASAREIVHADIAQAARIRQIRVEGHDRHALGQLLNAGAHALVLRRRKRDALYACFEQFVNYVQLLLCIDALERPHEHFRAGGRKVRGRAFDLLEYHVHEHGLDRLDDHADLDRVFRACQHASRTVRAVAALCRNTAYTSRNLRVNAASVVQCAIHRAAGNARQRSNFCQSDCHEFSLLNTASAVSFPSILHVLNENCKCKSAKSTKSGQSSSNSPWMEMIFTCHGSSLPQFCSAVRTAYSSPPQHGTSMRTTVTLLILL